MPHAHCGESASGTRVGVADAGVIASVIQRGQLADCWLGSGLYDRLVVAACFLTQQWTALGQKKGRLLKAARATGYGGTPAFVALYNSKKREDASRKPIPTGGHEALHGAARAASRDMLPTGIHYNYNLCLTLVNIHHAGWSF